MSLAMIMFIHWESTVGEFISFYIFGAEVKSRTVDSILLWILWDWCNIISRNDWVSGNQCVLCHCHCKPDHSLSLLNSSISNIDRRRWKSGKPPYATCLQKCFEESLSSHCPRLPVCNWSGGNCGRMDSFLRCPVRKFRWKISCLLRNSILGDQHLFSICFRSHWRKGQ